MQGFHQIFHLRFGTEPGVIRIDHVVAFVADVLVVTL